MRTGLASVLLLAAAGTAQQEGPQEGQQGPQAPPPAPYVAHEWGTFTSMVGEQGIALEGLHHEEEALPRFVHDLNRITEFEQTRTKLPASRVTQKMETPVIYFYSDAPMRVQASVWFQNGLLTQFYPLPDLVRPTLDELRQQRIDMSKIDGGGLTWDLDIVPKSAPAPSGIPEVAADDPWAFARATGAAWVRTRQENGSPAAPEAEHYVFYRGLGRWQPAMALEARGQGRVGLRNDMPQPVPFTAVLELGERGGRFLCGGALAAGASREVDLTTAAWNPDREQVSRRLGAEVLRALVQAGLYQDEARAMVATWSRSWFQKDGARAIYLLPREQVDAVLPLRLEPKPKELVRVLVGRLEFITPEARASVERALLDRRSGEPARVASAEQVLRGLDRFREPHLRNVAAHGSGPAARAAAAALLAADQR
jgi:hypothetical protein